MASYTLCARAKSGKKCSAEGTSRPKSGAAATPPAKATPQLTQEENEEERGSFSSRSSNFVAQGSWPLVFGGDVAVGGIRRRTASAFAGTFRGSALRGFVRGGDLLRVCARGNGR